MIHLIASILLVLQAAPLPHQDLLVLTDRDGQPDLYRLELPAQTWIRLTESEEPEYYARMDATGCIVFTTPIQQRSQLIYLDAKGERTQLTDPEAGFEVMEPFFSGPWIYYNRISTNLRDREAKAVTGEIWRCMRDGSKATKIIRREGLHFNPVARGDQLLIVANDHATYFDYPLALFLFDAEGGNGKRLTDGFEAHGSWLSDDRLLAIHYAAGEDDPLPTNVYVIPTDGSPWTAIGDAEWGEDVRFPNADQSGRFVVVTARTGAAPDGSGAMANYAGYRIWMIDTHTLERRPLSDGDHAAEGAWFIPAGSADD